MPTPVTGGVRSGRGAGVHLELRPPVSFILRQSGRFRRELADLDPLWDRFKPIMEQIEEEQFDSDGGGDWPALAESTLRQKAALGYPARIMVRTGDLRDSLVNAGRAAETTSKTMSYGTDVDYAHWHQDGGTITGRPPERELIPDPLPADSRRKLERGMVSFINDAARKTWGVI